MKKFRWFWLCLMIGQPLLVVLLRTEIRRPVASHYSLFGPDVWVAGASQGFSMALTIAFLLPLLILGMTALPEMPLKPIHWWLRAPRESLLGWLGLSNFLILSNFFLNSQFLTILWLGLNLLAISELLAYGIWLLHAKKHV